MLVQIQIRRRQYKEDTPLDMAYYFGYNHIIKILLDAGAEKAKQLLNAGLDKAGDL